MNLFKRNQVVITALVIMIAIAGYLNFTQKNVPQELAETNNMELETTGVLVPNEDAELSSEELVLSNDENNTEQKDNLDEQKTNENDTQKTSAEATEATLNNEESTEAQPGEAVFTNNIINSTSDFFIQSKLDREQIRAKTMESYMQIINTKNLTDEQKKEATNGVVELQKRIEKESAAEELLKAKGFTNAYVRINENGTVDVIVSKDELTEADRAKIEDIIKRQTNVEAKNITITPYNIKK